MALELRQQLKLSQQLVMTPQLQQAIKLLQLSRVELLETVQQELLENPFLEEAPANEPVAPQDQEEPRHEKPQDEVYDEDLSRNADWEEYLGEFASTPRTSQGHWRSRKRSLPWRPVTRPSPRWKAICSGSCIFLP